MEPKVLGLGNALVDVLVRIPSDDILTKFNLPKGSMQLVDEEKQSEIYEVVKTYNPLIICGGSAANTISGLSQLGINTGFIGKVGQDDLANRYRDSLAQDGTENLMKTCPIRTGCCISLISPDSERTLVTSLGAAVDLRIEDIDLNIFDNYTHIYVEGYLLQDPELIETALRVAHERGLITMLDLASYNVVENNSDFLHRMVRKYVDIVFANEEESTAFTGKEDMEAINEIGEIAEGVVLKLGRRGSLVKNGKTISRAGIINANSIDTTGAGDLYASGYIFGLINQLPPQKCAEAGAVTSGNVIEVIGTKMDARRWTAIRQRIAQL